MSDLEAHYRKVIKKHYDLKLKKNPRYSKNAYSKFLGISAAYYSKVMSGKLMMSLEVADKITRVLKLTFLERKKTLLSVAEEQRCHALYLIDPSLTKCRPERAVTNFLPKKRKSK